MPGANWAIFGCGTSNRHARLGIFRILSGKDEKSKETRDEQSRVLQDIAFSIRIF